VLRLDLSLGATETLALNPIKAKTSDPRIVLTGNLEQHLSLDIIYNKLLCKSLLVLTLTLWLKIGLIRKMLAVTFTSRHLVTLNLWAPKAGAVATKAMMLIAI
jgi:hypothetical protein